MSERLEIALLDGGVEEFESVPVQDSTRQNPTIPRTSNQTKALVSGGVLLTVGKSAFSTGVGLIGEFTGDYALQRKVQGGATALGAGVGLLIAPIPTVGALTLKLGSEQLLRSRTIARKQFFAQQVQAKVGKIKSRGSRMGGAK